MDEEFEGQEVEESESTDEVTEEEEQTDETEGEESETGEEEESATDSTDEEEKDPVKAAAIKRAQDERAKRQAAEERIQNLEREFEELKQKTAPVQRVDETRLNEYLGELRDEIDLLRMEGKHLAADEKELERDELIKELRTHRAKLEEMQQRDNLNEKTRRLAQSVDDAASFYAKERGVSPEQMQELGRKWQGMVSADKVLARTFWERAQSQGPVSAIDFAYGKLQDAIKAEKDSATEQKDKKTEQKGKQVSATPSTSGTSYKSFDELMKAGSAKVAEYKKNNPQHYAKLLKKAME